MRSLTWAIKTGTNVERNGVRWSVFTAEISKGACLLRVKISSGAAIPYPIADIGTAAVDVMITDLRMTAGDQRSISPNTMSSEPMIAETSASICPRLKKSIACRWANDGALILHL
jgi:hypothetical protein